MWFTGLVRGAIPVVLVHSITPTRKILLMTVIALVIITNALFGSQSYRYIKWMLKLHKQSKVKKFEFLEESLL